MKSLKTILIATTSKHDSKQHTCPADPAIPNKFPNLNFQPIHSAHQRDAQVSKLVNRRGELVLVVVSDDETPEQALKALVRGSAIAGACASYFY